MIVVRKPHSRDPAAASSRRPSYHRRASAVFTGRRMIPIYEYASGRGAAELFQTKLLINGRFAFFGSLPISEKLIARKQTYEPPSGRNRSVPAQAQHFFGWGFSISSDGGER